MNEEKRIEESHLLSEIQEVAGYLWERGWSEKNAGNISVLLPEDFPLPDQKNNEESSLSNTFRNLSGKSFFITGSGKRMRDIAKSARKNGLFIRINASGSKFTILSEKESDVSPTSELSAHLGIHNLIAERGSDEVVVLHTHATELIALTQNPKISTSNDLNRILWGMHPETMANVPKGLGLIPYLLQGSEEIAAATIESFKEHDIVVWRKHGIFAIEKTVSDCFDNIDIVCKSAKIWLECRSAGFEPEGLTDAELDELTELIKKSDRN